MLLIMFVHSLTLFNRIMCFILCIAFISKTNGLDNTEETSHEYRNTNVDFPKCPDYRETSKNFGFCNCKIYNQPPAVIFTNFSILPDPIEMSLPKFIIRPLANISIQEPVGLSQNLELSLSILLYRGKNDFFELCSLLGPSVCFVRDVCKQINTSLSGYQCPFRQSIHVPRLKLPPITAPPVFIKGTFVMQAALKEAGRPVGCLEFKFCVNDCVPLRDEL